MKINIKNPLFYFSTLVLTGCNKAANKLEVSQCINFEAPPEAENVINNDGHTELHMAIYNNNPELVQLLSAHPTIDVNIPNNKGIIQHYT